MGCYIRKVLQSILDTLSCINFVSKPYTTYLKWMTQYIKGLDVLILFLKWALFNLGVSYPEGSNYIFLEWIFRLKCLVSD